MAARQQIKNLLNLGQRDFYGIHDITSKDISAAFSNSQRLATADREVKYDALVKPRYRLSNEVQEKSKSFGAVRYDTDNVVKNHGQYEETNTKKLYDTVEIKQMFVPDREDCSRPATKSDEVVEVQDAEQRSQIGHTPYKISEVRAIKKLDEVLMLFRDVDDKARATLWYSQKPPLTFYFDGIAAETTNPKDSIRRPEPPADEPIEKVSQQKFENEHKIEIRRPQLDYDALAGPEGVQVPLHELDPMSEEYMRREFEAKRFDRFDRKIDAQYDPSSEPAESMKALEYLKKVRSKEIEPSDKRLKQRLSSAQHPYSFKPQIILDSQGHNVYKYQVPDWRSVRRVDVLEYIRRNIVYHNYEILAINKPYGIASHENTRERELYDMNSLVTEVAKAMRIERVFLAHRLDKTTTGMLLFATSEERARDLSHRFKSGDIKKTYWCITKGVPDPSRGLLDIPIGEFKVAGKLRSVPVPESLEEDKQLAKQYREARRAVTEYKVLDSSKHMALVECKTQTGVKHQIRCHLSFGIKTPILGDHKYSHLHKLAPQQLPQPVLDAFRVRQSKVRSLPMHLHAKSIVIPDAKANGETLFISAELPQFFRDNLKTLGLVARTN